jgi:hypothetical protein
MSNLAKHSKPAHRDALRRAWVAERAAARAARPPNRWQTSNTARST